MTQQLILGAIGDLVEDVSVHLSGPINVASDTSAVVTRSRGGSAANTAVAAADIEGRSRFIGQVGEDATGAALLEQLQAEGVEPIVKRQGRTGSVVVLVHDDGERTMLSDRGAACELTQPEPTWLDNLHSLHVPFYSLTIEPIATTTRTVISWARQRSVVVAIDASSTSVIRAYGLDAFANLLRTIEPDVLFCNEDEGILLEHLLDPASIGATVTIVHGPAVAVARDGSTTHSIPAHHLDRVVDTTGAGDAFAAGFLVAWAQRVGAVKATQAGHDAARRHLEFLSMT